MHLIKQKTLNLSGKALNFYVLQVLQLLQLLENRDGVFCPILSWWIVCLFMLTCGKGFVRAGLQWHPILWTDQSNCTKSELPNFVRNFYDNCRGPPRLFLLDKYAAFSLTSLSLSHLFQCVSQACCSKSRYEEILIYALLMRSKDVLDVISGFWGKCMYNEGIWWHQV